MPVGTGICSFSETIFSDYYQSLSSSLMWTLCVFDNAPKWFCQQINVNYRKVWRQEVNSICYQLLYHLALCATATSTFALLSHAHTHITHRHKKGKQRRWNECHQKIYILCQEGFSDDLFSFLFRSLTLDLGKGASFLVDMICCCCWWWFVLSLIKSCRGIHTHKRILYIDDDDFSETLSL